MRGRHNPKIRIVKTSNTDQLKNSFFLTTKEIKAGNDNPKLITEMDKLYKGLYGIDNAHLHFKKVVFKKSTNPERSLFDSSFVLRSVVKILMVKM